MRTEIFLLYINACLSLKVRIVFSHGTKLFFVLAKML